MGKVYRLVILGSLILAASNPAAGAENAAGKNDSPASVKRETTDFVIYVIGHGRPLWNGRLKLGGMNGSAKFTQSKDEFLVPCHSRQPVPGTGSISSEQLVVELTRSGWPENPDGFAVDVTWSRPLSACDGEGSNAMGFRRTVNLLPGQIVTLDAGKGLRVTLLRERQN